MAEHSFRKAEVLGSTPRVGFLLAPGPSRRPAPGPLDRMSRYVETFIRNLTARRDAPAGRWAAAHLAFPDAFPLT
jgi:hypothetical protein